MHAVEKANLDELQSFTTRDGSQVRELAGPSWSCAPPDSDDDMVMTGG